MSVDLNLIGNVFLAIVLYKMVVNVFVMTILKMIFKTAPAKDMAQDVRKSFKEKLEEKQKQEAQ